MEKTELFESVPIPKALTILTVPTILSSLVMVLYNLADTYFVGMLNDPVQNAAVTLAAPLLLAFNAVNNLFGVGASSMMSRALGKKDYRTVSRSSAFGFWCALTGGVLLSVLSVLFRSPLLRLLGADADTITATAAYIKWTVCLGAVPSILNVVLAYMVRSEGNSLHASIGTMSGCLLNIVLDPIFILPWGLGMGASGAGLATLISNCIACCYFFVLLLVRRSKTYISINPKDFSFRKEIVGGVFGVGLPASVQNLLNVTGMTILNNFTAVFGANAVAAMGISQKLSIVPLYIALGFSQGLMPLVGYNYASGNTRRMKGAIIFSEALVLGMMTLSGALYFVFAPNLTQLFMTNDAIIGYGTQFLRGFCLAFPLLCTDFLAVGVFQAVGFGRKSLLFAILRKIVLEIPALYILNKLFPLYGIPYAQVCAELIMAVLAIIVMLRWFKQLEIKRAETSIPARKQR